MAVTEVIGSDGAKSYCVYVNLRSKIMPNIRFQKRLKGIGSKSEAYRIEKKLIKDLTLKISNEEGHGFSWRLIISKWANYALEGRFLDKDYDLATIKDYVAMMFNWTEAWLDRPAAKLTIGDGREVIDLAIEKNMSRAFQIRLKNTINLIYSWGIEFKHIRGVKLSPLSGLRLKKKSRKRVEVLNLDEMKSLLLEAKKQNHPWFSVWALALYTGMRNGELYALRWEDIDFDNRNIIVQRSYSKRTKEFKSTKAGYWRNVPISEELHEVLKALNKERADKFVLPRLKLWEHGRQSYVLKEFCKRLEITPVNFHTLRASFATQLIASGVEPIKVMKVCGWRDLKTMAYYMRMAGVEEKGITDNLKLKGL